MSTSTGRRRAQRNVLCIHYAAGYCREGDACRFRHDMSAAIIDVGMCWEWDRTGECKKRNCRYRHDFARDAQIIATMTRNRVSVAATPPRQGGTPTVTTTSASSRRVGTQAGAGRGVSGPSGTVTGSTRSNAPGPVNVVTTRSPAAANRLSPGAVTTTARPPSIAAAPPVSIRAVQTSLFRTTTPPSRPSAPVNVPATLPPSRTIITVPAVPDSEVQCGICFEEPYIFGLLSGCSHVFCWKCIDGWRKSQNAGSKNCPMCRTHSAHHVLSELFLSDGDAEKRLLVQEAMNANPRTVAVPCGCGRTHINIPQAQVPSRPRPVPLQLHAYVYRPTPPAPAPQNGRTVAPVRIAAVAAPSQAAGTSRLTVGSTSRAAAPPIVMRTPSTSTAASRYGTATPAAGYTRPTTNRVEIVRRGDAERENEQTTAGWVIGLAAAAAVGVYRLWFS
ncbi:hypothetical protein EXIGLDRAFT_263134 [Exidia glandulosa HHB12029]|uniref:Uncharacterized protein n=1 Tax=Exidia glandulosa HHB12029 TaxID=1314781 RepID=A0A165DRJ2_EXIGL|nr:hypothetical protein EXIGLDRAFT_263134 [Exidia glandulosa HHB12029]